MTLAQLLGLDPVLGLDARPLPYGWDGYDYKVFGPLGLDDTATITVRLYNEVPGKPLQKHLIATVEFKLQPQPYVVQR